MASHRHDQWVVASPRKPCDANRVSTRTTSSRKLGLFRHACALHGSMHARACARPCLHARTHSRGCTHVLTFACIHVHIASVHTRTHERVNARMRASVRACPCAHACMSDVWRSLTSRASRAEGVHQDKCGGNRQQCAGTRDALGEIIDPRNPATKLHDVSTLQETANAQAHSVGNASVREAPEAKGSRGQR